MHFATLPRWTHESIATDLEPFLPDSGSSIVGAGIRENAIAEALYCTIDDEPEPPVQQQQLGASGNNASQQVNGSQSNRPVYAIPSMTSPPPTYDVAIAKSWQV